MKPPKNQNQNPEIGRKEPPKSPMSKKRLVRPRIFYLRMDFKILISFSYCSIFFL